MTVHMIRLYCEPPKGEAENAVNNWVTNYNEWDGDPVEHTLEEQNTAIDGTGVDHLVGDYRFIQEGEDPTNILNDLSGRLQNVNGALWHRIGYHVCTHGEQRPQPCTWDETAEYGAVPTAITDMEVE